MFRCVVGNDLLKELRERLLSELNYIKNQRRNEISVHKANLLGFMAMVYLEIQKRVGDDWSKLTEANKGKAFKKVNFFISTLNQRHQKISEAEMESFKLELYRLHKLFDLLLLESHAIFLSLHILEPEIQRDIKQHLECSRKEIHSLSVFTKDKNDKVTSQLKAVSKLLNVPVVTDDERRMVHIALFGGIHGTNRWYVCRGCGDVYCVGECGQVNQVLQCSKCRTTIGDHSRVANSEMAKALQNR